MTLKENQSKKNLESPVQSPSVSIFGLKKTKNHVPASIVRYHKIIRKILFKNFLPQFYTEYNRYETPLQGPTMSKKYTVY
jgi:hypothetical protein